MNGKWDDEKTIRKRWDTIIKRSTSSREMLSRVEQWSQANVSFVNGGCVDMDVMFELVIGTNKVRLIVYDFFHSTYEEFHCWS